MTHNITGQAAIFYDSLCPVCNFEDFIGSIHGLTREGEILHATAIA
jgi:hypothetical protein